MEATLNPTLAAFDDLDVAFALDFSLLGRAIDDEYQRLNESVRNDSGPFLVGGPDAVSRMSCRY